MSIQALAWAFDQPLPGKAKLVLLALSNHADHTTGRVHFDVSLIAAEAVIPERSLWRYLGALERNAYISKDSHRTPDGEKREYWLALDRDPTLGWAWGAQDQNADDGEDDESDSGPSERPKAGSPPVVLSTFRRADQDAARATASAAAAAERPERVGVIEGSKAFDAWLSYYRDHRKVAPFVMNIIVNGQQRRGFEMPTLFPPAETVEADRVSE